MKETFSHTKIKNMNGIKNWNIDNVTVFDETFSTTKQLESIEGIEHWLNKENVSYKDMFLHSNVNI